MTCKNCKSSRIASVNGKCRDLCTVTIGNVEHDGYVPDDLGIGGDDYIEFDLCLDCGQIAGRWPLKPSKLETREQRKAEKKAKREKKKKAVARDKRYTEWLDMLAAKALARPYGGANEVLGIILAEDDHEKVIAGVVELFRHHELAAMAETVYDKFTPFNLGSEWEHWAKLKEAVAPFYKDDYDDEDDEDY